MRINRFLAWAGVAARRKADELVRAGRVRLNGRVLREVGVAVDPTTDKVTVDGRPVELPAECQVVVFHKPVGYLVSRRGQGGKPTIYAILPETAQKLQAVGRLDFDTDGILLLTNDGELSRRLQHPKYQIERVYVAIVARPPLAEKIKRARLGIDLGDKTPARAKVRVLSRRKPAITVEVRIAEGRKHEVRRLLKWMGAPVKKLSRVSFAGVTMGNLPLGACRRLRKREVERLRRLTGLADGGAENET